MEQKHDFRPYDDAKAMAGDPVGCRRQDYEVKVFLRDSTRIIGASREKAAQYGMMASEWSAREWARNGHLRFEALTHPLDLVMLPLCYIQDKPAYPGDTLYDANGEAFQLDAATAAQTEAAKEWAWEKPAPAVKTKMTLKDAMEDYSRAVRACIDRAGVQGSREIGDDLLVFAEYAIARAIADGQVVPTSAFFGVPGTTMMLYGTPEAAKAACDYFLTCEPADRQNRASDITMDMGMHGTIKGNRAAIDHVRLLASLPEKVAAKVVESAANIVHSKVGTGEVCTFQGLSQSIREINTARIIRKVKGE